MLPSQVPCKLFMSSQRSGAGAAGTGEGGDGSAGYLTPEERAGVLAYAKELPARVRAAQEVEDAEGDIVAAACDGLRERYPRYQRLFPNAWDRCAEELRLVLRYDV